MLSTLKSQNLETDILPTEFINIQFNLIIFNFKDFVNKLYNVTFI